MTHPSHDDLTGYALGALDPEEERTVSRHVPDCERCSTELRERIYPAVGVLAESVPQLEPPPELRERLLEIVRAEAEVKAEPAKAGRGRRSRLGRLVLRPAAGLAVLAVVAAGVAGYLVANDGDEGGGGVSTVPVTQAGAGIGGSLVVAEDYGDARASTGCPSSRRAPSTSSGSRGGHRSGPAPPSSPTQPAVAPP